MIASKPINISDEYYKLALQGEPILYNEQELVIISMQSYKKMEKAKYNAEYLAKIDESLKNHKNGDTITFTMEELIEMESDDWKPTEKVLEFERKHNIQKNGKNINE